MKKNVSQGKDKKTKTKLGALQFIIVWFFASLLLMVVGGILPAKLVRQIKAYIVAARPDFMKGMWKKMVSFFQIKKHLRRMIHIPFNRWNVLESVSNQRLLLSTNQMTESVFRKFSRIFLLMAVPTPENVITGIIGTIKKANRYDRALEIINACAISTYVTIAPADITIYRGHLTTFNAVGTASQKQSRWLIVYDDLKILLSTFQLAATANQSESINILESGKFKIKGKGGKGKQVFSLTNGVDSGTVDLTGNTVNKGARLHDWWISMDLGVTWTRMAPTLDSTCQATGLPVGKSVGFRHQLIVAKGDNGPLETLFITIT